ncbi:TPA: hypothetical protein ACH3X1_002209 [Trebouxia sp. C0004]
MEGRNSRKRGRPPGRRCTYMTQDCHGNIIRKLLSPFKVQKLTAGDVSTADQQNGLPDLHRHLVGGVFTQPDSADAMGSPQSSVAYDQNDSPVVSPAAANADSPDAIETEQPDVISYARQLSAYLGLHFIPVHCAQTSEKHFCLPDWDPAACKLSVKKFHLPGIRKVSFEDGEQLTWWCDCHHTLESARSMFANAGFPAQPSEWLEGRAEKCLHIKALEVLCRWQHTCLMDLATRQPAEDLKAEGSCDTVLVQHVKAIQGDTATEAASVEDREAAWLRKFGSVFDRTTARRRVTSISQAPIAEPHHTHADAPEAAVMSDRADGRLTLPDICYPWVSDNVKCDQSHLQKPWAPAHDAELTPGSMHSARVLVGSKHTRKLLKRFIGRAQDVAAGLNDLEYEEMLLLFQDDHTLFDYLERAPILQDFLAWDMSKNGSSLSSSAVRLLEVLLSLARAAYMPATMGEYKGRSKCAQKQSDVVSGNTTDWTEATEEELFFCTGHYFPAMPRQRNLQRYLS